VPLRSHGSLSMNRALMAAGLVDRVQMTLFPVTTGQTGLDPIFHGAADFDLELVENRTVDGHIQELIYGSSPKPINHPDKHSSCDGRASRSAVRLRCSVPLDSDLAVGGDVRPFVLPRLTSQVVRKPVGIRAPVRRTNGGPTDQHSPSSLLLNRMLPRLCSIRRTCSRSGRRR
jgi:RibD C-terminal domain